MAILNFSGIPGIGPQFGGIQGESVTQTPVTTPAPSLDALSGLSGVELQRAFFDISQQNLQPFLDISNQQLPGLERSADPGQAFDIAQSLRPTVEGINAPIFQQRSRELNAQLGARGLTRSGFAATSAADLQQDLDLSLLLQLQQQFTGRRQAVAGQGQVAGSALGALGQQSAENIGGLLSANSLLAQQQRTGRQQNVLGLAGLGLEFLPQSSGALNVNNLLDASNVTSPTVLAA